MRNKNFRFSSKTARTLRIALCRQKSFFENARLLRSQQWTGRLMIEMWNDDAPDCAQRCASAREFVEDRAAGAGIRVVAP